MEHLELTSGTEFAGLPCMPQIFVDDVPQAERTDALNWGDLLAALDDWATREGVVLASARFDGVDQPSFRDAAATGRPLDSVHRVDILTATPRAFLAECLNDSIGSLAALADSATGLSAVFRKVNVSAGHEPLRALAGELQGLTGLVGMLTGPLGIDLDAAADGTGCASEELQELGRIVESLVAAQSSTDWLTVADILEYDVEPAIRRWIALLTRVAARLS